MDKKTVGYLLLAGLVLSILSSFGFMSEFIWIAMGLALVAGFYMSADVKTFLAVLVLSAIPAGLSQIPAVGTMLMDVMGQIAIFFGAVAVIPAAKVLLGKAGLKW